MLLLLIVTNTILKIKEKVNEFVIGRKENIPLKLVSRRLKKTVLCKIVKLRKSMLI